MATVPEQISTTSRRSVTGRPRDAGTDAAILRAAGQLLIKGGYSALSFEAVARLAGTTRPAIYRRWPSRLHLAYEAAFHPDDGAEVHETGSFAEDLAAMVRSTVAAYSRPVTRAATPGILAELQYQPALRSELRQPHESRVRSRFGEIVASAKLRGEADEGLDADALFDTIVGAVQFRLVYHERLDDGFMDVLLKILQRGTRPLI